ncbi:haloacid dehalogenase (plasmid) [Deinococcus aetherius]|uniref:Haloacid dehalogenase n=1 Tax=Deinococcus aetherius TaxID=200252 RepID=A0ABN6RLB4_9DEIO|nr:HAD family hydrolase [Deinococcus aetherius]BDP43620.1 haloacid dehalogenase [Deinococcus aetherius]
MLFAFDLDGTLVTREHVLPEPIREAIVAVRDAGHLVTVITGRHERDARAVLDALGIDAHYATCHGARVHARGDEHHAECCLEPEVVRSLLEHAGRSSGALAFLSARDRMFVHDPGDAAWDWARRAGHPLHAHHTYADEPVHRFVLATEDAARWRDELRGRHPDLTAFVWEDRYVEVVAAGGHKGDALARLAAVHGVAQEDTVAFGDGVNDIEMLRWAGHAVGVGELQPGVAAVIHEHIPGPEELGVAQWLRRHVLGNVAAPGLACVLP